MYATLQSLDLPLPIVEPVRIKVKVIRRVEGHDSSFMPTLDFLLVDEEGTKIHATVNTQAYERFEDLPEGAWVQINGAIVSSNNRNVWNHYITPHRFMLVLPSTATVTPIPPVSDHNFFKFTPFEDVISGFFNDSYPIDLIGTIHTVGQLSPAKNSANAERSIPFTIRNTRGVELYCIAYGRIALDFSYQWRRRDVPVVRCLLSEWRVSKSRRVNSVLFDNMIVDGGAFSRFWFNPEIPGVDAAAMVRRNEPEIALSEVVDSGTSSTT